MISVPSIDALPALLVSVEHVRAVGYASVCIVAFLEALAFVGLVVPGTVIIVALGALAAQGYLDLGDLIAFATVGAVLGDGVSFEWGRRSTTQVVSAFGPRMERHLGHGFAFFKKYGAGSVVFARFVGPVRPIIPFVAGMSRMPARRFYVVNVLSAVAWAAVYLFVGYLFGDQWRAVEHWSLRIGIGVTFVALLGIGMYMKRKQ